MSEKHYYQPEIETMPEEQLRALQSEKLVKAVQHVYADVRGRKIEMEIVPTPFYKR